MTITVLLLLPQAPSTAAIPMANSSNTVERIVLNLDISRRLYILKLKVGCTPTIGSMTVSGPSRHPTFDPSFSTVHELFRAFTVIYTDFLYGSRT